MDAASSMVNETKINAFEKIHAELEDVLKHEKCRTCSCFHADVLNIILAKIKAFRKSNPDLRLIGIETDFERWVKEADFLKMHG